MTELGVPAIEVEEGPAVPPAIQPAATSVCGLVGAAASGPTGTPVAVTTRAEVEQAYGAADGWLTRAAADFLAQGGERAVLVRATGPDDLAALDDEDVQLLVVDPAVADAASAYSWCEAHRVFLVADAGAGGVRPDGVGRDAAVYYPPLLDGVGDGDGQGRERGCAPSVAGIYARTDANHGVWRSPAGIEAEVLGALPATVLDSRAVDRLVAGNVNPLRREPSGQLVLWAARTAAPDQPEWRYVAVRRLMLFVERSIARGLTWTVFEPDAEETWSQARRLVEEFLFRLWRHGALPGGTPDAAFFVRCDRTTMTQDDLDAGRLVVEVGVAVTRPAEFVVLRVAAATADGA